MKQIEVLLCHEDGTWQTEYIEIPDMWEDEETIKEWIDDNVLSSIYYRKFIYSFITDLDPEINDEF